MSGKLSALKNIAWAIAIVICLLAVLVGIIISMTRGFYGVTGSTTLELGEGSLSSDNKKDGGSEGSSTDGLTYTVGSGTVNALPETEDGGSAYLNRLTFLCDSTLIGLRDYGLLAGGKATTQVWGSSTGSLPIASINEAQIEYPADGSDQSIVDAVILAKPDILVIAVGTDGLSEVDQSAFLTNYRTLVRNIQSASPETTLICCGNCSVGPNYTGSDALTPELMSDARDWVMTVCAESGAYYADIGYPVGDGAGNLFSTYASSNGKSINSAGIQLILDYLKTHAIT